MVTGLLALVLGAMVGCGDPPAGSDAGPLPDLGTGSEDAGADVEPTDGAVPEDGGADANGHDSGGDAQGADAGDGGGEDGSGADGGDAGTGDDSGADGGSGALCNSCAQNEDCPNGQCVTLPDNESRCAIACNANQAQPCPEAYFCAVQDDATGDGLCIPDKLTCVDRCTGKTCPDGEVCDPLSGQCRQRLGLCDTNCSVSDVCGDGPEDICITMPGTMGRERICATGCNPEADVSNCPVNYGCVPVSETEPTEGICVPIEGTCVDRCSNVNCPDGSNCNQLTGQCEQAQYGVCETGCASNAQCGDGDDWCLDIGIGQGSHCWADCSDPGEECPSGYDCVGLNNSTVNICIPKSRRCDMCYGSGCFPGGACDPTTGMCNKVQKDCTKTGCGVGEVCDPRSTRCVKVGRACSGDSWAGDCDNVKTACTTRRKATEGQCALICQTKSDCSTGEACVATNLRKFCLGADLGGPEACGTLRQASSDIGEPCTSNAACPSGAPTCVTGGNIAGFCSKGCTSDADCSTGACQRGPGGQKVCLPAQCRCAAGAGLGSGLRAAFDRGLKKIGIGQCDLAIDASEVGAIEELKAVPLARETLQDALALPMSAAGAIEEAMRDRLDARADDPGEAVIGAAALSGWTVVGRPTTPNYSGPNSKLTQAVARLITVGGKTPMPAQIEMKAKQVPSSFQDVAAPIIMAVADAVKRRDQYLTAAGWGAMQRRQAFAGAPYLMLPGTSAQQMAAPDLSKSATVQTYEGFPTRNIITEAANLSATISRETKNLSGSGWTGFSFVVDTPAGKVILGDAGNTTYDAGTNPQYAGDIAVLIDAGGDDTYKTGAGANGSANNGVSLLLDLGGSDSYGYPTASDPNDTAWTLPSDGDGRAKNALSMGGDGPVSLSARARQGGGRVGIGMLVDLGNAADTYESLRMSQGAAVFGVGMLYDAGGADTYTAEALSQGGALGGLAILWDGGSGNDTYKVWHAGQGFGAAGGTGLLFDRQGTETYRAVQGEIGGKDVLYYSPADRGASNRSLAQGVGAGITARSGMSARTGLAGGLGVLRDLAGADTYIAATNAQGYGAVRGMGVLGDQAGGDLYIGRVLSQGAGQFYGAGMLRDAAGKDVYNYTDRMATRGSTTRTVRDGQGFGESYGWGLFWEGGGDDAIAWGSPGGGVGLNGGFGIALEGGGNDSHVSNSVAGWGFAQSNAMMGDPLHGVLTVGIFAEAAGSDTYTRNVGMTMIGDNMTWLQPDPATDVRKGVGVDR